MECECGIGEMWIAAANEAITKELNSAFSFGVGFSNSSGSIAR